MVGYAYYVIAGRLGVLAGLSLAPEWNIPEVGRPLLQATLEAIRQHGVPRIESQCIPIDCPWLSAALEPQGFYPYWREVLRLHLQPTPAPVPPRDHMSLESWQGTHVHEAAAIMQAAYAESTDAAMNTLYRTVEGCHLVLDQLLNQGGCGRPVTAASALVRHRGQGIGCIVITETAPHQGHLVQVAVLPAYQRHGVGRWLLRYSMSQLAALHCETLSLLVSRANHRALAVYHAMGFHAVLSYPVFVWEQSGE
jgi:N-acetylglutamate synthase-like GNAT family acetyltransferase